MRESISQCSFAIGSLICRRDKITTVHWDIEVDLLWHLKSRIGGVSFRVNNSRAGYRSLSVLVSSPVRRRMVLHGYSCKWRLLSCHRLCIVSHTHRVSTSILDKHAHGDSMRTDQINFSNYLITFYFFYFILWLGINIVRISNMLMYNNNRTHTKKDI